MATLKRKAVVEIGMR